MFSKSVIFACLFFDLVFSPPPVLDTSFPPFLDLHRWVSTHRFEHEQDSILSTDMVEHLSSDAGSGSHDDTNTAETIEKMFEEVLEYAEKVEENRLVEEDGEGHDSGISACSGEKGGVEKSRREEEPKEEESDENDGDELLTFPKGGILSPLSKSVEAVVTPLVRTLL